MQNTLTPSGRHLNILSILTLTQKSRNLKHLGSHLAEAPLDPQKSKKTSCFFHRPNTQWKLQGQKHCRNTFTWNRNNLGEGCCLTWPPAPIPSGISPWSFLPSPCPGGPPCSTLKSGPLLCPLSPSPHLQLFPASIGGLSM